MNDRTDIERALRTWFDEGPTKMPDRVVTVVADRIGRQPQRHAWRLPWRLPMISMIKLVSAAAAVVILAVVGWNMLPGRSDGVGGAVPTPTPTTAPTASPSATAGPIATLCPTSATPCLGPLAAGQHASDQGIVPFAYVVPDGWRKSLDVPGSFSLEATAASGDLIAVVPDWAVVTLDRCDYSANQAVGRTVEDIVSWLVDHPSLTVSAPTRVTIGGLAGQTLDITMAPSATGPCTNAVNLFTHEGTVSDGGGWSITDEMKLRLYVLATADGHTVTIHVETDSQADFDTFVQMATPVVESFVFE